MLSKNERCAAFGDRIAIAFFDRGRGTLACKCQVFGLDGEVGTGHQANQIDRVCGRPGFVEIVHTPNQTAFDVPPGAKIFDVQVAYSQNLWPAGEFRADDWPPLRPAIKGGTKERKRTEGHQAMFQIDIGMDEVDVTRGPLLKIGSGKNDIR